MPLAERLKRRDHVVLLALAGAAGREQHIAGARGVAQDGVQGVGLVGRDAEIDGQRAGRRDQARQHRHVGVVDLTMIERHARPHDLVAGRQHADFKAPIHRHARHADGREGCEILRAHDVARPHEFSTGRHVLASLAHVGAGFQAGRYGDGADAVALANRAVLLHRAGVVAGGHDGAGEDARGGLCLRRGCECVTRGDACGDGERAAGRAIIFGGGEAIAIDGGVGVVRHRYARHGGRCENPAVGIDQCNVFPFGHRRDAHLQDRDRLGMCEPRAVGDEAVVSELAGHGLVRTAPAAGALPRAWRQESTTTRAPHSPAPPGTRSSPPADGPSLPR